MSSPEPQLPIADGSAALDGADVFTVQLGRALTMERDIFSMLAVLERHTAGDEAKGILREHARQAQYHITSLENVFQLLGRDVDDAPAPAVQRSIMDATTTVEASEGPITDALILAEAAGAEHQQIAVYETLITDADESGTTDVAAVLRHSLEQDRAALVTICGAMRRLA